VGDDIRNDLEYRSAAMEVRQYIRPDVAASAIAHLSVLGLVFFLSEVHPFGSVTAEPITVDIVTADQLEKTETRPDQSTAFPRTDSLTNDDAAAAPTDSASAAPQKAGPPQQQSETSVQKTEARREAALQPQQPSPPVQPQPLPQLPSQPQQRAQPQSPLPVPQTQSQPPPPPASSSLGYVPATPDVTIKYHVFLGLPPDLSAATPSSSGDKPGDGVDATASEKADIASSAITQFRQHLKTCSKLPASVAASDNVRIKLRVTMRPDGKLAAEPILIEGTASMKGLELKQSAVSALMACQPYAMLPADRYGEWRVLDLSFTPDDFTS
jgi:hypothetical protein